MDKAGKLFATAQWGQVSHAALTWIHDVDAPGRGPAGGNACAGATLRTLFGESAGFSLEHVPPFDYPRSPSQCHGHPSEMKLRLANLWVVAVLAGYFVFNILGSRTVQSLLGK